MVVISSLSFFSGIYVSSASKKMSVSELFLCGALLVRWLLQLAGAQSVVCVVLTGCALFCSGHLPSPLV